MKAKPKKKSEDKPPSSPQVGNKPSMEDLVKSAESGDDKSFLALVKIHTSVWLVDKVDYKLIIPSIGADRDFYEQPWVQKRLQEKMDDGWFEKDFWKAVSSGQNDTLLIRSSWEIK
jgi:hypothetical protein